MRGDELAVEKYHGCNDGSTHVEKELFEVLTITRPKKKTRWWSFEQVVTNWAIKVVICISITLKVIKVPLFFFFRSDDLVAASTPRRYFPRSMCDSNSFLAPSPLWSLSRAAFICPTPRPSNHSAALVELASSLILSCTGKIIQKVINLLRFC